MAIIQPSSGLETGLRQQSRAIVAEADIRANALPRHAELIKRASDMLTHHEADGDTEQGMTPWVLMPTNDMPAFEGSVRAVNYALRAYESPDGSQQAVDVVARQRWPHPFTEKLLVNEETLARLGGVVCFELAGAEVHEAGVIRKPNDGSEHFPSAASITDLENIADTLNAIESALQDPARLAPDSSAVPTS